MLYLLSTPFAAQQLAGELEQQVAPIDSQAPEIRQAQAILVLGGGRYTNAPEYGSDTVGPMLLERLRFAARLSRETGLPIIPSGGSDPRKGQPEADLAKQVLEQSFQAPVVAVENRSRTTWENAQFSAELLKELNISKVLLVTHAWHIPRAERAFQHFNVDIIPAPTCYISSASNQQGYWTWLPSADALQNNYRLLHEYAGDYWYQVKTLSL
ncbi:MAG: YdcF family protein, partial [Chromatiales bacterium]|nr:YdcF family protein [Chromatiales bacterium]